MTKLWPESLYAAHVIEVRIGADDPVASTLDGVRSMKCIPRAKTVLVHEPSGSVDHRGVCGCQVKVEGINGSPKAPQLRAHPIHCLPR